MAQLQLDIVTPDNTLVSQQVDYVSATGVEGEFGVLPQHVPLLAALACGKLSFRVKDETKYLSVSGGFAEVNANKVTILAEAAEFASDIDADRAFKAKERAEERLKNKDASVDEIRAKASLQRAIARLQVISLR